MVDLLPQDIRRLPGLAHKHADSGASRACAGRCHVRCIRGSPHSGGRRIGPMSDLSHRARAAQARAAKRWYVYLILCRNGAIYTGIARNVAVRYAQHVAGNGARYTRANPPRRLLVKFACLNQSEAGRMEAAIKKLNAADKRKLVGKTRTAVRKLLLG